jgi:isopenicillin-N epimerase
MMIHRRNFLRTAGIAAAGSTLTGLSACNNEESDRARTYSPEVQPGTDSWEGVRAHFELDPEFIHMAGLLLASHPTPVRDAISEHRKALNQNPAEHVQEHFSSSKSEIRQKGALYMGVNPNEIALTDSTTMGTALVITGLHIREDQEMLTTTFDYYSTHESMRYQSARSGAAIREVPLYQNIHNVTEDEIVDTLIGEVRPETRLVTATWVHSATGLKVPVKRIADRLAEINSQRSNSDRAVFFVDGVHGFGVENVDIPDLGCDFFSAGTHKWLFGPRGTGIMWGNPRAHNDVSPTIPTFTNGAGWGGRMSPGGFKAFEHEWALAEAFQFQLDIGKERVQNRIHEHARQLKEGLQEMDHVTLYTPMDENLSSGIVCFDIDGRNPADVVRALVRENIIASDTPYTPSHARLTPGIYNTPEEVEETLRAVHDLG